MLENVSKRKKSNIKVVLLGSALDKSLGALRQKKQNILFFKTRFGIHTFFMKRSLDVLIMDSSARVIKLKQDLKPNRIFLWDPRYDKVLELPVGLIQKLNIKVGDILRFYL